MSSNWLEQVRFLLQSIQVLQKAIINEMLYFQDNPKQVSIIEHRMVNYATMIQSKVKSIQNFVREESAMKKQQLLVLEGQKSLKVSEKKKPADIIWQNFYDRVKQLKQYSKKQQSQQLATTFNNVEYYKKYVFSPPFKQPEFSLEQAKGKYMDLHAIYLDFIAICKVMEQGKDRIRFHDYLWFLQNLDKFDDFLLKKKLKHEGKYINYLSKLKQYLLSFLIRSKPRYNLNKLSRITEQNFQLKYQSGRLPGWQKDNQDMEQIKLHYCAICKKLFISNEAYVTHLTGKKHNKMRKIPEQHDYKDEQIQARKCFFVEHENRKRKIAFSQFEIYKLREELATVLWDTMNLVRKKQTRGYEEVDEMMDDSQQSEQIDAPIYNPKNLPLGWDDKPIPYWLYKLHGLGIEYKCEICGNYSYWGRRAFQTHFQEWRHTYGMKCLKIPNTIHFKDVTTISDALALHEKLMRQSRQFEFRPELDEQFQDNQGNILNKRTYFDMKKQGLIN